MNSQQDPIELEAGTSPFDPERDKRQRMELPPSVRLVAVDDCLLTAPAGLEVALDHFYVSLLGFEREPDEYEIVYRAENARLRIEVIENRRMREDFRPLGVALASLNELVRRLNEQEIEFVRQRGLSPGLDTVLLIDPAGNPIEISEFRIAI